jgi:allantoinase
VVLPHGVRPATIVVHDGRIAAVGDYGERPAGAREMDVGAQVVIPGLVDTHVHINDPGRAEWEGFEHATRAAAAGGVTTLVDMPLNSVPPTTSLAGLEKKREAARGRCYVDVGFWGGVVPGNVLDLAPLAAAGVFGFKCFLTPSGVEEFGHVGEADLREALPLVAALHLPLLAHAELPALLEDPLAPADGIARDPRRYSTWLNSRPDASECAAIEMLARLAAEFGARIHIVHLATANALPAIRSARAAGAALTVETCPHYLCVTIDEMAGDTRLKWNPPSRDRASVERLWELVAEGAIHTIGSDHAPLAKIPGADIWEQLPGAGNGLETMLSIVATEASKRGIGLSRVIDMMSTTPARLFGLAPRKGAIALGADADFAVLETSRPRILDANELEYHEQEKWSPYDGREISIYAVHTILRGRMIVENRAVIGDAGYGRHLTRVAAV